MSAMLKRLSRERRSARPRRRNSGNRKVSGPTGAELVLRLQPHACSAPEQSYSYGNTNKSDDQLVGRAAGPGRAPRLAGPGRAGPPPSLGQIALAQLDGNYRNRSVTTATSPNLVSYQGGH